MHGGQYSFPARAGHTVLSDCPLGVHSPHDVCTICVMTAVVPELALVTWLALPQPTLTLRLWRPVLLIVLAGAE